MHKSTKILLAASLALLAFGAFVLSRAASLLLQLFIALALAYVLNPAVRMLERRGVGRMAGTLTVFGAALLLGTGFTLFLAYSLSAEFSTVQLNLPAYARHLYDIIPPPFKSRLGIDTPERIDRLLNDVYLQARSAAPDLVRPLLEMIRRAFSSTVALFLTLVGYLIIPIYLFYLLTDLPRLGRFLETFVPERHRGGYDRMRRDIDRVLSGFVRGQLLICAILALLYSIGLYLIGIDLAIAIGTLAGIAFIVPYLGTVIGMTLAATMALLKFHDLLHPLLCLGWFGIVQLLEGMVITPRVVGDTVGLHPLVTIVALMIGGQLFGLTGMLLAVPLTAVLQVLLSSLADYYRSSEFYRSES